MLMFGHRLIILRGGSWFRDNTLMATAKPLRVKSGGTGYNVTPATNAAPWTNTAIFSSVTYDL